MKAINKVIKKSLFNTLLAISFLLSAISGILLEFYSETSIIGLHSWSGVIFAVFSLWYFFSNCKCYRRLLYYCLKIMKILESVFARREG